jgi:uncharacterized phiE125 gp8 family phage protein
MPISETVLRSLEIRHEDYLVTGPSLEPVDLIEMKKQRRFTSTSLDTLFEIWIGAGRQQFEEETGLQLMTAQRCFALDEPPADRQIQLGRAPVQRIDRIVYDDEDGHEQVFSPINYRLAPPVSVDTYPKLGVVELMPSCSWPSVGGISSAFRIHYWAGYGDTPEYVPAVIQYAVMLAVGTAHRFGESVTAESRNSTVLEVPGVHNVIIEARGRTRRTLVPRRMVPSV